MLTAVAHEDTLEVQCVVASDGAAGIRVELGWLVTVHGADGAAGHDDGDHIHAEVRRSSGQSQDVVVRIGTIDDDQYLRALRHGCPLERGCCVKCSLALPQKTSDVAYSTI